MAVFSKFIKYQCQFCKLKFRLISALQTHLMTCSSRPFGWYYSRERFKELKIYSPQALKAFGGRPE